VLLAGAIAAAALAAALLARPAAAASHSANHGPSYQTGIGDEQGTMFSSSLYRQLHTKVVRYIAPYDAAMREYSLIRAEQWIRAAEAQHLRVLVAFYHSEYTKTRMPSVATYRKDVAKFIKIFPHVREYQAWDEANRGYVRDGSASFASPSAALDAKYYQALKRACQPCTVVGLDVLDQENIYPTLGYIAEFKREIHRLHTLMPSVWGLHNYSDVNRFQSWRTRELTQAMGSQVWLTETGGIVKFGGAFPNNHGSGLRRAARVLKYMFAVAAAVPRIRRLYIYDWTGGTSRTRFDAGLMNAHEQPREGYRVVCRELHAAHCAMKIAKN
jgi:hypothetical protein